ncbi:unnamed protein product [Brassicogethes aeneus]|uniref:DUF4729 domain-containing protein n=1 Tax=Brassicogethes aeneus TaxID=1431903 RepID=A0A9P0B8D5_BRAAE|nr:unnamed protein product [Brassicogethes aeneus]
MSQSYENYDNCESCGNMFEKLCLLESKDKNYYCMDCFKRKFTKDKYSEKPRKMAMFFKNNRFIPNPEHHVEKIVPKKSTSVLSMKKSCSTMSLSKRPLQCPHGVCSRFVSITTLSSHFKYEHPMIQQSNSPLDNRMSMSFTPTEIRYDLTTCLRVITITDLDLNNIIPNNSKYDFNFPKELDSSIPVFFLLARRIPAYHIKNPDENIHDILESYEDDEKKLDFFKAGDKIILWIACNIPGAKLSYTIAASTISNDIRLKYYGPLLSISNHSPAELCKTANCLIISHWHCYKFIGGGARDVPVDVVIHED